MSLSRSVLCLLVLSSLMLTACTTGSSSTFYGLSSGVPPHAILIDISGSMGNGAGDTIESSTAREAVNITDRSVSRANTGSAVTDKIVNQFRNNIFNSARKQTTKLAESKRQLIPFIRGMPDGTLFNIMVFNNSVVQAHTEMIVASPQTKESSIAFVRSTQASGGTLMLPALNQIMAQNPKTIYLVTDGHPSDSASSILDLVRVAATKGIVINTVGIGKDQNRAFLSQIAGMTGGTYSPQGVSIPILLP